jgi:dihydrofolate synthase/folylpolyglutamate synthase
MAVDGSDIDHAELADLVDQIKPLIERVVDDPRLGQPTEFEIVTVLALTYFARRKVDLVVLEAGLGGRLDATNVVTPMLSIITNISLEHTEVLGDTIEKIAFEKAGIIKPGVPLLTAAMNEEALAVFEKRSFELNSLVYRVYPPQTAEEERAGDVPVTVPLKIVTEGQYFSYKGFKRSFENLFLPLRGRYQLENAATALAAVELLAEKGFICNEDDLRRGVAETVWPGRLELLEQEPLLIMDGAHNPEAMKKLAEALPVYFNYNRLILVIGILADKDKEAMLRSILPLADTVIFTKPLISRAAEPGQIAAFAVEKLGFSTEYHVIAEHGEALDKAMLLAAPDDAVIVTGSLYTVSDIRAYRVRDWN